MRNNLVNGMSQKKQDQSTEEPLGGSAPSNFGSKLLSNRVSLVFYLFFIALIIKSEREFILSIADPGTFPPSLFWQLLWPTGLIALALLLPRSLRWFFLGISGGISMLLLAGDAAYFDFFGTVTSSYMITSMHQLFDVRDSVISLTSYSRIAPLLGLLPFFFLGTITFRNRATLSSSSPKLWIHSSWFAGLVLILVNLLFGFIAWRIPIYEDTHHLNREKWIQPSEHWTSTYSRSSYAATFGVFNYHVMDLFGMIRDRFQKTPLRPDRKDEIHRLLNHKAELNKRKSPLWGAARGRHVIIVQLESLQHFLLDLEVRGHEVMPFLDTLKQSSLNWDLIFDVSFLGRTSDAEFATLTSLLPDTRRPASYYSLSDNLVSLPKELKRYGYATTSLHGFKRSFWNRAYTHPAYGIEALHFEERFRDLPKIGLGVSDKDLFRYSTDLLESSQDQQQFLFIISLSSHHPYIYVDDKYLDPYDHLRLSDGYGLLAPYLASASYTDEALSFFWRLLEDRKLLQDSLLVIYGDHDRGGLGAKKPIPEVGDRMNRLTEDRIPLVISIPGQESLLQQYAQDYVGVVGGLHDLAPTILHLLGETIPKGMMGTHLFVENSFRDPLPLPNLPRLYAYRGVLSLPNGSRISTPYAEELTEGMPNAEEAITDQVAVQDLLDHYDEVMVPDSASSELKD